MPGTIKKLTEKGFGFISTGGREELFFHMSAVQEALSNSSTKGSRSTIPKAVDQRVPGPRTSSRSDEPRGFDCWMGRTAFTASPRPRFES